MGLDSETHSQTLHGEGAQAGGLHWETPLCAKGTKQKREGELWEPEESKTTGHHGVSQRVKIALGLAWAYSVIWIYAMDGDLVSWWDS